MLYSRETSRPKILTLSQSMMTRTRLRAVEMSVEARMGTGIKLTAEDHRDISGTPEQVCEATSSSNLFIIRKAI